MCVCACVFGWTNAYRKETSPSGRLIPSAMFWLLANHDIYIFFLDVRLSLSSYFSYWRLGSDRPVCDSSHLDYFTIAADHIRAVPPCRVHRHVGQQETWRKKRGKRKKEEKRKWGKKKIVFTLHYSFSLHLLQLPATITMPKLHGKVAERVRGACGMDTVYRFAPHPSQSSKGVGKKKMKKIFNSIPRYNSCTHGRGTFDTCLSANTPLHRSTHCGSARTYRLEKEALHSPPFSTHWRSLMGAVTVCFTVHILLVPA